MARTMPVVRLWTSDLASACGGRVVGADVIVDGASFDSRSTRAGQLFVPVVAERDGHRFVGAAIDAGAAAYLTSAGVVDDRATAIEVADTAAAFMDIGHVARARLPDHVVGVTGSVGKTTVKDLCAAVLSQRYRTAANVKSFNNELGLPATLLNAPDDTEVTVLEMGMSGLGEIARLCAVGRPTVGVITIIGEAHTGRVGGVTGVARAKGELIEALPATGTAVLNADQPICLAIGTRGPAPVLSFGLEHGHVRATDIVLDERARPRFTLRTPDGSIVVELGISGAHNAANAAAAAAVGLALGLSLDEIAAGLTSATVSPWRMEIANAPSGATIVNDAYNANPTSMRAALDALVALGVSGRRIAVLGPMAELDEDGPAAHRAIAALARDLDVEVITVGAPDYGAPDVDSIEAAIDAVGPLSAHDAVLVKGSRVAELERLAAVLIKRA